MMDVKQFLFVSLYVIQLKFFTWFESKKDPKEFEKKTVVKTDETKSEDYKALYNRGISLSKLGKYVEAIKKYDKAIEIKPDYQVVKDNQEIVRKN